MIIIVHWTIPGPPQTRTTHDPHAQTLEQLELLHGCHILPFQPFL